MADHPKKLRSAAAPGRPWATAFIAGAAAIVGAWPAAAGALIYDRASILDGQFWRLWTGHAVHLDGEHLLWNLVVFVPAGVWLEHVAPRASRRFLALAPAMISLVLLAFAPELGRYAGLSGLATGLVVLLALDRLWMGGAREPHWVWGGVLGLVAVKMLVETSTGGAVFVHFGPDVRVVPLVHIAGSAVALTEFFAMHRKIWLR